MEQAQKRRGSLGTRACCLAVRKALLAALRPSSRTDAASADVSPASPLSTWVQVHDCPFRFPFGVSVNPSGVIVST